MRSTFPCILPRAQALHCPETREERLTSNLSKCILFKNVSASTANAFVKPFVKLGAVVSMGDRVFNLALVVPNIPLSPLAGENLLFSGTKTILVLDFRQGHSHSTKNV